MEAAIFDCPPAWEPWLPAGVQRLKQAEELTERVWSLLALTPAGLEAARKSQYRQKVRCKILLAPGECGELNDIQAETVVTYGLSPRDSLTLSSLEDPILCVQRTLPRPDGADVELGEFPLPKLPLPAEELLPLLGLWLLQMPLTGDGFWW